MSVCAIPRATLGENFKIEHGVRRERPLCSSRFPTVQFHFTVSGFTVSAPSSLVTGLATHNCEQQVLSARVLFLAAFSDF